MKIALIIIVVLIVIIGILHLIAPKDFLIEREVIINKPKDIVFNKLKLYRTHHDWNPWGKKDPNIVYTNTGIDGTVGSIVAWKGNKEVGAGEEEIKSIIDGERIDSELRFKEPMEDTSSAYLVTEAVTPSQTKVKWGMKGQFKFPGNIICMLINMQKKLGADFEKGLNDMKAIMEKE